MKLKVFLQAAILLVLSVCTAQAITVTDIGRNPFYTPPLTSVDDLRYMMDAKRSDIMEGLNQAGYPELYQPLREQFPTVSIARVEYHPGQIFYWMLSRYQGYGSVHAVRDMVWGGAASFAGYEFQIYHNGARYTFSVPLICGNLALKEIIYDQNYQTDQNYQAQTGQNYQTDQNYQEQIVDQSQTTSYDDASAACYGAGCLRFVTDIGYLRQSDPADHFLLRLGMEYQFMEGLSLLSMIGGAPHIDGADGKEALLIDFLLQYDWFRSPLFIAVGLGGWITDGDDDLETENTDLDVILNLGTRLHGTPETFTTSLFFEARSGIEEFDSLSEYGRFGAGLRFRF